MATTTDSMTIRADEVRRGMVVLSESGWRQVGGVEERPLGEGSIRLGFIGGGFAYYFDGQPVEVKREVYDF